MYTVLIVDDEKMIRMGMRQAIRWQELGIGNVFTAGSGKEALEIIEREEPEIVITDISMTGMTGLDLIGQIRENYDDIRILVLTGYDRFDYARECLRMQVQDFLLKPIDEELLSESVKKQVQELEKQKEDRAEELHMIRTMGSTKQMELENMLRKMLKQEKPDEEEALRFLKTFGIEEPEELQTVILFPALEASAENKNSTWEDGFQSLQVKDICMSMVDARSRGLTFQDEKGRIVLILFGNRDEDNTMERITEINDIILDEFDDALKIVAGSRVKKFSEFPESYREALAMIRTERKKLREIILPATDIKRDRLFREIYSELKSAMSANVADADYVLHVFESFRKATRSYNLSNAYVRKCCFEVASAVYFSYISDSGENVDGRLNALLQSLANANREESCEMTEMFLKKLLVKEDDGHDIVTKAKSYIKEHLADDLSVSSLADEFFLTPNYFSRLFKKVTGEGCNEYIVRKRIEQAKLLLEMTTYKTGKIAIMVGYRDTNYFSMAFKKQTGVSPTKYRENMKDNRRS